jgi:hypothetical protein
MFPYNFFNLSDFSYNMPEDDNITPDELPFDINNFDDNFDFEQIAIFSTEI